MINITGTAKIFMQADREPHTTEEVEQVFEMAKSQIVEAKPNLNKENLMPLEYKYAQFDGLLVKFALEF